MIAQSRRNRGFFFGTERSMKWFPTPNRGASMNPEGWLSEGTLLNGGGYNFASFGSHKTYSFEWSGSSARETAQLMKSYADGTYGRGLIYFQDCLMFDTNVLPARVADPSMAIDYEGASLVYGITPKAIPALSGTNNFPVTSAQYNLNASRVGFNKGAGAVFIPIPEGYTLLFGAAYSLTSPTPTAAGVFLTNQDSLGNIGTTQRVTPLTGDLLHNSFVAHSASVSGVWVWVGRQSAVSALVTLQAMSARLVSAEELANGSYVQKIGGPWIGGQGHSGCRFSGKPTYIANGPVNGGQIGFAATFREVGSWVNG